MPPPGKPALAALAALTLAGTGPAFAALTPYTDYGSYQSAAALGSETVQGFDTSAADTVIGDGDSLGDVTFSAFDLAGADMQIVDRGGQTSSDSNALESSLGAFVGLDGFTLTMDQPVAALGLSVITGDTLADGDPGCAGFSRRPGATCDSGASAVHRAPTKERPKTTEASRQ